MSLFNFSKQEELARVNWQMNELFSVKGLLEGQRDEEFKEFCKNPENGWVSHERNGNIFVMSQSVEWFDHAEDNDDEFDEWWEEIEDYFLGSQNKSCQ